METEIIWLPFDRGAGWDVESKMPVANTRRLEMAMVVRKGETRICEGLRSLHGQGADTVLCRNVSPSGEVAACW